MREMNAGGWVVGDNPLQCGGKAQSHIIEDQLSFNAHSNQDGQLAEHWEVADFTTLALQLSE